MIRATLIALFVLLPPAMAHAQDDEDHRRVCALLSEDSLRVILPEVKGHGACKVFCTGCGCKGGPGYRDAERRCVSYANIIRKCGPPPHAGCAAECAPVEAGCDHGRVWVKAVLTRAGLPVRFIDGAVSPPAQQHPFQRPDQPGDSQPQR